MSTQPAPLTEHHPGPCPFCGEGPGGQDLCQPTSDRFATPQQVVCLHCGARGPVMATAASATACWQELAEALRHGRLARFMEPAAVQALASRANEA